MNTKTDNDTQANSDTQVNKNQANKNQAKRLVELRIKKGMSQEQLAEMTKLSLRTIQRVEKGETTPRGNTLQKLSKVLQITPEEFIHSDLPEDKNVLTVLHLSQLSFFIFPLLGIFIPLVIWLVQKNNIRNVDDLGKAILNYQISWNLANLAVHLIALLVIVVMNNVSQGVFFSYVVSLAGLYGYSVYLILSNTVKAYKGTSDKSTSFEDKSHKAEEFSYRPAIQILRFD